MHSFPGHKTSSGVALTGVPELTELDHLHHAESDDGRFRVVAESESVHEAGARRHDVLNTNRERHALSTAQRWNPGGLVLKLPPSSRKPSEVSPQCAHPVRWPSPQIMPFASHNTKVQ